MRYGIRYINMHIKDELDGAEDYMHEVSEQMSMGNNTYAQMFYTMAIQELTHAESLMKMLDESIKKWDTEHPDYSTENNVYKSVFDSYYAELKDRYMELKEKASKMK